MERASKVLVSNVRLNKKTGDRRKRTGWTKHDETGNEAEGAGRTSERRTTKRETERNGRKRGQETGDATDGTETRNKRRTKKRETRRTEQRR